LNVEYANKPLNKHIAVDELRRSEACKARGIVEAEQDIRTNSGRSMANNTQIIEERKAFSNVISQDGIVYGLHSRGLIRQ